MRVTRRYVLLTASVAATVALPACAPASDSSSSGASDGGGAKPKAPAKDEVKGTIRVHVGGDTNVRDLWQTILAPAFTEKYPDATLDIQHDLHSERSQQVLAKLASAGDGDPGIDFIDEGLVLDAAKSDLLVQLDESNVPQLANIAAQDTLKPGMGQAIPYRASSVLLAHNPAAVPEPPKTLDELLTWIQENQGSFAYNSPSTGGSGQAFVVSVLDLFIDEKTRAKLETGSDPADEKVWDKGFEKLTALGPSMYQGGVYPNGNSQVLDLLASGQISMAPVWSDQFLSGQASGTVPTEVKAAQISDPSFTGGASYIGIPKHARTMAASLALADFLLDTTIQAKISDQMAGYPVLPIDSMPAEVKDKFADAKPEELRLSYSNDHLKSLNEQWDQKVPSGR